MTTSKSLRRRMACRIVGHKITRVKSIPGSNRYYSHPRGERAGCRRCRTVLPEGSR